MCCLRFVQPEALLLLTSSSETILCQNAHAIAGGLVAYSLGPSTRADERVSHKAICDARRSHRPFRQLKVKVFEWQMLVLARRRPATQVPDHQGNAQNTNRRHVGVACSNMGEFAMLRDSLP